MINLETGRRDDLESVGYVLVYFLRGRLPWDEIVSEEEENRDLVIKERKESVPISVLCEGLPGRSKSI
jgi:hypothetical protein